MNITTLITSLTTTEKVTCNSNMIGIIVFLVMMLIGISMVSVHYRKKYEEERKLILLQGRFKKNE